MLSVPAIVNYAFNLLQYNPLLPSTKLLSVVYMCNVLSAEHKWMEAWSWLNSGPPSVRRYDYYLRGLVEMPPIRLINLCIGALVVA